MKKLLTIIFFLPFLGQSQGFIGYKKKDLFTHFEKQKIDFADSSKTKNGFVDYQDQEGFNRVYIAADTVSYYQIYRDSSPKSINKTKLVYDENLYPLDKWAWMNHTHGQGSFYYTCEFPKDQKYFITTVQKTK